MSWPVELRRLNVRLPRLPVAMCLAAAAGLGLGWTLLSWTLHPGREETGAALSSGPALQVSSGWPFGLIAIVLAIVAGMACAALAGYGQIVSQRIRMAFLKPQGLPAVASPEAPPGGPALPKLPPALGQKADLASLLATFKGALIGVSALSGVSNLLMLTGSLFMLEVYDRVLPSRSTATLSGLVVVAAILFLALAAIDIVRGRVMTSIGAALDDEMCGRVYKSLVRLPLLIGKQGDGLQPVRDLDAVRTFISGPGLIAFFDLPWLPLYLLVIFLFHPVLGIVALLGAMVLVALTIATEFRTRKLIQRTTAAGVVRNSLAEASQRNAEVAVAMGMTGRLQARWQRVNSEYMDQQRSVSDIVGDFGATSRVFRLVLQSAVLAVGAYLVIIQQASSGVIIASSIIAARALAPVDLAIAHWKTFVAARQSWQRLTKLSRAIPEPEQPMMLPDPTASLTVSNLTVVAPGSNKPLVQGVSFAIEAGSGIGIIGPSASGKSTLARALVGAWRPSNGKVMLDSASIDQWGAEAIGQHVGYLPQDVELFDGTVAENISRFELQPDASAILAAAEAAGVHELVVGLRGGYEAQVGHDGAMLSAGQRQRIALARALYRNPFLVVLDEPNSNLDVEGEHALGEAIRHIRQRGGIVAVVAHRPSVLGAVDYVLVMSQGQMQAFGPRDQVLAKLFPKLQPVAGGNMRLAGERSNVKGITDGGEKK